MACNLEEALLVLKTFEYKQTVRYHIVSMPQMMETIKARGRYRRRQQIQQ